MVNQMVMGYTLHLMVTNMKANGRLGKYMDKVYTFIQMVTNMKENGRLGKNLVKVHTLILVDLNMKGNCCNVSGKV